MTDKAKLSVVISIIEAWKASKQWGGLGSEDAVSALSQARQDKRGWVRVNTGLGRRANRYNTRSGQDSGFCSDTSIAGRGLACSSWCGKGIMVSTMLNRIMARMPKANECKANWALQHFSLSVYFSVSAILPCLSLEWFLHF